MHQIVVDRRMAFSAGSLQEQASYHNASSEKLRSEADARHNAVASQRGSQQLAYQDIVKGQLDDAVRAHAQRGYEVHILEREAQRMQHLMQQQTHTRR